MQARQLLLAPQHLHCATLLPLWMLPEKLFAKQLEVLWPDKLPFVLFFGRSAYHSMLKQTT